MITTRQSLIIVTGNPHAKIRPRISKGGRRTHQDPRDAAAEKETRRQVAEQWGGHRLETGNLKLSALFFRKNRQIVDLDNLVKHLLDSCQGVVFVNDAQVTAYDVDLFVDSEAPRTTFCFSPHSTTMIRNYTPAPQ